MVYRGARVFFFFNELIDVAVLCLHGRTRVCWWVPTCRVSAHFNSGMFDWLASKKFLPSYIHHHRELSYFKGEDVLESDFDAIGNRPGEATE